MKVIPKEILDITSDQSSKKKVGPPNENFGNILKEAMDTCSVAGGQTTAAPPLDGISRIAFEKTDQANKADTVKRIQQFMDILESYQSRMEDSTVTLKQVSPLVSRMEEETQNLIPVLDSLPAGDNLKDILNRLLVASTVEVIKFNRGDYLA
jgi:hypothetical protein